eukprot:CAMPEP_0113922660 /NCGR_PEP_ID=MMETSP1159-20121227/1728_1 /TAXON_ID=88271 /ORGANISM="Picocystis salinarum" /LENGTH=77 /DNA_ID=CAMNT_0000922777 /DNA_START=460 /DNA_END=691 /DNA_ORIENTATION=+ /assembly_acc=CAM_ASM_000767
MSGRAEHAASSTPRQSDDLAISNHVDGIGVLAQSPPRPPCSLPSHPFSTDVQASSIDPARLLVPSTTSTGPTFICPA